MKRKPKPQISPCIPVCLPLKRLKRSLFAPSLKKAHLAIGRWNEFLKTASAADLEKKILEEAKCSKHLPVSAIRFAISQRKITLPFIWSLHRKTEKGSGMALEDIGKWRNRQNWIGPEGKGIEEAYFFPPDLASMKKGLKNLQAYLKSDDEDPLVQAAIGFAQFLILHPFMDGNGKVARLLIPLFLTQKKAIEKPYFFMSRYFNKHRLTYFHKLYLISSKNKWEEWIRFFLRGIAETVSYTNLNK